MADNEGPTIEGLLAAYGYSHEIPINAKIRLQQSLDLEKRLAAERDHLEKSRDEANKKLRESEKKYQDLFLEMNKLKLADRSQVSELESELKLKRFDVGRLHILLQESEEKYKTTCGEKDQLLAKIEALEIELLKSQVEASKKISDLSLSLQKTTCKLETYEKVENELDQVVVDAAAVSDDANPESLLDEISFAASMPRNVKRRMHQCFSLAKRVFSLERTNTEYKAEIYLLRDTCESLREQLNCAREANKFGHEPTSKLINVIMCKNMDLIQLEKKSEALESRIMEMQVQLTREQDELTHTLSELEKTRKSVSFGPTSVTTFFKRSEDIDSSQSDSEEDSCSMCSKLSNNTRRSRKSMSTADVLRIRKPLVLSKVLQRNSFNYF